MAKKTAPEVLGERELGEIEGGASGRTTGKRQHMPFKLTTSNADSEAEPDTPTGSQTITYTGLE